MTKQTANGATEAEKLVEVQLLRNYVPVNAEQVPDAPGVFIKRFAGEVIQLPRSEAKAAIASGIAAITADLV